MTALQQDHPQSSCWTPCMHIADSHEPHSSPEAGLIQALMCQPEVEDIGEQMNFTARQLSARSGWRWAAIARLTEGGKSAQLLAMADRGRTVAGFTYDMAISPCSAIAMNSGITHLDDVSNRYNNDVHLRHLGVHQYAGLAYRLGDQRIGHVFLMHDEPFGPRRAQQVDPLLQLTTLHVGHRLQLHGVRNEALGWQRRAETDALTQLSNRHAFERELELQRSLVASGAREDSLLVMFDIDGLKSVNDTSGHLAGDDLLRRTGELLRGQLRRRQDDVFRIGGDEFALLIDAPKQTCDNWLIDRIAGIVKKMRLTWPEAGLSVGIARLSETRGSREQWLALADSRMYEDKATQRIG